MCQRLGTVDQVAFLTTPLILWQTVVMSIPGHGSMVSAIMESMSH